MELKHNIDSTVYKPNVDMKRSLPLFVSLFVLMHAIIFFKSRSWEEPAMTDALFFFILILLLDLWLIWQYVVYTTQTYMIVSEDGIAVRRGGVFAFTPWDNISHFGLKGGTKNRYQGIYLHSKIQPEANGWVEKLFYSSETDFLSIGQVINLPTRRSFLHKPTIDCDELRETEFGQDLLRHAPYLLQERDEDK